MGNQDSKVDSESDNDQDESYTHHVKVLQQVSAPASSFSDSGEDDAYHSASDPEKVDATVQDESDSESGSHSLSEGEEASDSPGEAMEEKIVNPSLESTSKMMDYEDEEDDEVRGNPVDEARMNSKDMEGVLVEGRGKHGKGVKQCAERRSKPILGFVESSDSDDGVIQSEQDVIMEIDECLRTVSSTPPVVNATVSKTSKNLINQSPTKQSLTSSPKNRMLDRVSVETLKTQDQTTQSKTVKRKISEDEPALIMNANVRSTGGFNRSFKGKVSVGQVIKKKLKMAESKTKDNRESPVQFEHFANSQFRTSVLLKPTAKLVSASERGIDIPELTAEKTTRETQLQPSLVSTVLDAKLKAKSEVPSSLQEEKKSDQNPVIFTSKQNKFPKHLPNSKRSGESANKKSPRIQHFTQSLSPSFQDDSRSGQAFSSNVSETEVSIETESFQDENDPKDLHFAIGPILSSNTNESGVSPTTKPRPGHTKGASSSVGSSPSKIINLQENIAASSSSSVGSSPSKIINLQENSVASSKKDEEMVHPNVTISEGDLSLPSMISSESHISDAPTCKMVTGPNYPSAEPTTCQSPERQTTGASTKYQSPEKLEAEISAKYRSPETQTIETSTKYKSPGRDEAEATAEDQSTERSVTETFTKYHLSEKQADETSKKYKSTTREATETFAKYQSPSREATETFTKYQSPSRETSAEYQSPTREATETFTKYQSPTRETTETSTKYQSPTREATETSAKYQSPTREATETFTKYQSPTREATETFTKYQSPTREATETSAKYQSPTREATETFTKYQSPSREATETFTKYQSPTREATETFTKYQSPTREATETFTKYQSPTREATETFTKYQSPTREATETFTKYQSPTRESTETSANYQFPRREAAETSANYQFPTRETAEPTTNQFPTRESTETSANYQFPTRETAEPTTKYQSPVKKANETFSKHQFTERATSDISTQYQCAERQLNTHVNEQSKLDIQSASVGSQTNFQDDPQTVLSEHVPMEISHLPTSFSVFGSAVTTVPMVTEESSPPAYAIPTPAMSVVRQILPQKERVILPEMSCPLMPPRGNVISKMNNAMVPSLNKTPNKQSSSEPMELNLPTRVCASIKMSPSSSRDTRPSWSSFAVKQNNPITGATKLFPQQTAAVETMRNPFYVGTSNTTSTKSVASESEPKDSPLFTQCANEVNVGLIGQKPSVSAGKQISVATTKSVNETSFGSFTRSNPPVFPSSVSSVERNRIMMPHSNIIEPSLATTRSNEDHSTGFRKFGTPILSHVKMEPVSKRETSQRHTCENVGLFTSTAPVQHTPNPAVSSQETPRKTTVEPSRPAAPPDHINPLTNKGDKYSFELADDLKIHICYGDLVGQTVDAIVNTTDGQLTHVNKASMPVAAAAGNAMIAQCQNFLRQNGGPLETSQVFNTVASGTLVGKVSHILHVSTPMWNMDNENQSSNNLLKTYLNCMNYASDRLKLKSIAFPLVGSEYPPDITVNAFFKAMLVFIFEKRPDSELHDVTLVIDQFNLALFSLTMIQAFLEQILLEGIDGSMAEAVNSYYGDSQWERQQNNLNQSRVGADIEEDTVPKILFRGPAIKRPKL